MSNSITIKAGTVSLAKIETYALQFADVEIEAAEDFRSTAQIAADIVANIQAIQNGSAEGYTEAEFKQLLAKPRP